MRPGRTGRADRTANPPRVEVSCRSQPVEHVITVRDWGEGIPLEYHAKAMRLFQRIHTKKSGTGVGLASVAKIMELMGGRVWLDNPEGGGLGGPAGPAPRRHPRPPRPPGPLRPRVSPPGVRSRMAGVAAVHPAGVHHGRGPSAAP